MTFSEVLVLKKNISLWVFWAFDSTGLLRIVETKLRCNCSVWHTEDTSSYLILNQSVFFELLWPFTVNSLKKEKNEALHKARVTADTPASAYVTLPRTLTCSFGVGRQDLLWVEHMAQMREETLLKLAHPSWQAARSEREEGKRRETEGDERFFKCPAIHFGLFSDCVNS